MTKPRFIIPDDFDSAIARERLGRVFAAKESWRLEWPKGILGDALSGQLLERMIPTITSFIEAEGQEYKDPEKTALFILSEFFRCTREFVGDGGSTELWSTCHADSFYKLLPESISTYFTHFSCDNSLHHFMESDNPLLLKVALSIFFRTSAPLEKKAEYLIKILDKLSRSGSAIATTCLILQDFPEEYRVKFIERLNKLDSPLKQSYYVTNSEGSEDGFKGFRKAADAGFLKSQHDIALHYEGMGNVEEALKYYTKAAASLYPDSMHKVAFLTRERDGEKYGFWLNMMEGCGISTKEHGRDVVNPLLLACEEASLASGRARAVIMEGYSISTTDYEKEVVNPLLARLRTHGAGAGGGGFGAAGAGGEDEVVNPLVTAATNKKTLPNGRAGGASAKPVETRNPLFMAKGK